MKTAKKMLIAKITYRIISFIHIFIGRNDIVEVVRSNLRWELDIREGIDLSIYIFGSFERSTVKTYRELLKPGHVVLDIGANIGAHTLIMADIVGPNGSVIAFEPTDYAYHKLIKNIELNSKLKNNINPQQIMLTNDNESIVDELIYSSWPVDGNKNKLHPIHKGEYKTTSSAIACTLDSFLKSINVNKVDFVKIDVDGYEYDIFCGAEHILSSMKPILCFELAPHVIKERGKSVEMLINKITSYGYQLYRESNYKKLPNNVNILKNFVDEESSINIIAVIQ